ncbi:unnamed protein product [Closterium sp. Naga37s-1]|nr:unnamed protein product [Closterium sp. Naga37s-1]
MYRHTALHHASCGKLSLPRAHVGRPLVPPHIPLAHSFQARSRVALNVSAAAAASTPDPAGFTPLNAGARIPRRVGEVGSACQNLIRQQQKRALRSEAHAVAAPDQYGVADSPVDCASCDVPDDADVELLQCFPDFVLDPSESDGSTRLFRKSFSLHDASPASRYFPGGTDCSEGYVSMPDATSSSSPSASRFSLSSEAARPPYSSMSPRDAMPLHASPDSSVTDTSLVQPSSSPRDPSRPQPPPVRVDELKQGAIRAIIRAEENYRQAFHALQEAQARLESTRMMAAELNAIPPLSLPPSPHSSPAHSPPASPLRSASASPSLSRSPSASRLDTVDATLLDLDVHVDANGFGVEGAGLEGGLVGGMERAAEPEVVVAMMDSLAAQRERSRESLRMAEQVLRDRLGEAYVQVSRCPASALAPSAVPTPALPPSPPTPPPRPPPFLSHALLCALSGPVSCCTALFTRNSHPPTRRLLPSSARYPLTPVFPPARFPSRPFPLPPVSPPARFPLPPSQVIDHHIEMMDCGGQYHVAHWLVDKVQEIASASSRADWSTANAACNGSIGCAPVGAGAVDGGAAAAAPLAVPVNLDLAAQGYDDHAVRFLQHLPYDRVLKIRTIASDPPVALLPSPDTPDAADSRETVTGTANSSSTSPGESSASSAKISAVDAGSVSPVSAGAQQGAAEAMPLRSAVQSGQQLTFQAPWANLLPGTVGWSPPGLLPAPPPPAAGNESQPRETRSRRARVSKRTAPATPPPDTADGGESSAEPVWLPASSFELAEAAAAALSQTGAGLAGRGPVVGQWKQWDPLDLASSSAFVKEFGDDDDDAYDARLVDMAMAAAADRGQEEKERQAWMRMELLLVCCAALYMAWHCDAVSLAKDVYVLALGSGFAFLAAQFVGLLPQRRRSQLGVAGLEGTEGIQGIRCPLLVHMAATSAGLGSSADTLLAAGSGVTASAAGGGAGEVWRETGEGVVQEEAQQQQLDAKRHRTWEAAIEVIGLVSALLALSTVLALLIKSFHLLLSFLTSSLSHGVTRGVQVLLTWFSASQLSAIAAWPAAGWMSTTAALPSSILTSDFALRGAVLPLSLSLTSAVALTLLLLFRPANGSSQRA